MMAQTMSVEFRGAIVEVVYRPHGEDDVMWEFVEDSLNRIMLSGQERRDIRDEALAHSRRG